MSFSEIWRASRAILFVNLHIIVILAVVMVVVNAAILSYAPALFWLSAIYALATGTYLVILFHHSALHPGASEPIAFEQALPLIWPFLWRSLLLGVGVGLAVGLVVGILSIFGSLGVALAAVLTIVVVLITVGLFGTVFPAIVDDGDTSWRAAFERAEHRIWPIVWMFLKGPFAIALLSQLAVTGVALAGWPIALVMETGGVSVPAAILAFVLAMAQHIASIMAVVVLCHVYRTDQPT